MPESPVDQFDLDGESLASEMLGLWGKIPVSLQQVCAIAHRRQVLDLLPKDLTRFDRPSSTGKTEDLAKDGVDR